MGPFPEDPVFSAARVTALLRGCNLPGDSWAALLMINGPTCAHRGGNMQKQLCFTAWPQIQPKAASGSWGLAPSSVSPERPFSEDSGISSGATRRDQPAESMVRFLSFPGRVEQKLQVSKWFSLCTTFALAKSPRQVSALAGPTCHATAQQIIMICSQQPLWRGATF